MANFEIAAPVPERNPHDSVRSETRNELDALKNEQFVAAQGVEQMPRHSTNF